MLEGHQREGEGQGAICRPHGVCGEESRGGGWGGREATAVGEDQLQEVGQEGCGVHRLDRNRGGHDDQEGLKGGEAPARQGRANDHLHGDPKEEA